MNKIMGHPAKTAAEPVDQNKMRNQWQWRDLTFRAMNTEVQTRLYTHQPNGQAILQDICRLFASFEKRLSRFDPDSELSRLNAARQETFSASPILFQALETALWAAGITGGLYDPTILGDLEAAGYDRSFDRIADTRPLDRSSLLRSSLFKEEQPHHPVRRAFTFRSVQLNRARGEIHRPVGLRLDLGGMGKGWTVDRAADRLQGLGPFLVNAGGDIFAYHSPPGQRGWPVDIIHPLQPDRFTARLYLHHRALATSTIAKRRWRFNNRIMHHLIDPRTGQPAQTDVLSVSVVADRTVVAEILAKTILILGVAPGLAYLQAIPGVEGLIFTAGEEIVYTNGLTEILDRLEPSGYSL